jgi:A/G-specific adenine glycosylase
MSEAKIAGFRSKVWDHYADHRRDLPWRRTRDAYMILVSEVMLQQTQVARVLAKYGSFIASFPTVESLAAATVTDVFASWSGLGYNRRALWLQRTAKIVVDDYRAQVPASLDVLRRLPGVGRSTAAAVCLFAFDQPQVFVETNIRSAFIHCFFPDRESVADSDILPLVEETLDREHPRDWYYALMDYGAWVKKQYGNPSRRSKHHAVQTPFAGSRRELRAQVLRVLLAMAPTAVDAETISDLLPGFETSRPDLRPILVELAAEGFLMAEGGRYRIA